jgi:cytochrome b561
MKKEMTGTATALLTPRYSKASIGMHWLMVLAFAGLYGAVNLIDAFPEDSSSQKLAMALHFSLGMLVFTLVWLRLLLRLLGTTPPIVPALTVWRERLVRLGHLVLYLLMVAMPLLGWAARSAFGKPVPFFGVELPALVGADEALGHSLLEVHEWIGTLGYSLIAGHAALALFHHYVVRDNTLRRMLLR